MLRRVLASWRLWWGYRKIVAETVELVPAVGSDPAGRLQPQPRYLAESVEEARLRDSVGTLASSPRHPTDDQSHHAFAARYISSAFRDAGLSVREQTFRYGHLRGRNLIATKPGTKPWLRPILVCAHYDTVRHSPGADDNASGIAALLECARILADTDLPRTVEFAALDLEEIQVRPGESGLLGSSALATATRRDGHRYAGVYNLEMIGYAAGPGSQRIPMGFQWLFPDAYRRVRSRAFRGDGVALVAVGKGKILNRRLLRAAAQVVPGLQAVPLNVSSWLPVPDLLRSDHTSFWLAGMPATTLTDTGNFRNPHYHSPADTADTLDYHFLYQVTKLLVATVAQHASEDS